MLYCIEIYREIEEVIVEHTEFETSPTRDDILKYIEALDCGYDDDYGKIKYYRVD
jgi:hypothetical protein